ncbi:MAG: amino acid ABC transporter permease [Alphaproteobacteria bacterium]|nr:amino acid ABC transporter permease [Alphaproteobacteria bacterium]
MGYHWNWMIFWEPSPEGNGTYFDMLMSGVLWTLATAALSSLMALVLGSVVGVARTLPSPAARAIGRAYVEIFRNIPLLVQMFLWYFVVPELLPVAWGNWLKQMPSASFVTAVISLGFYTSARVAEQVRAGIGALPRGQAMAAKALGMSLPQAYLYVLLPMAYRIILPPLTNELLSNLKNTSVALTIGLMELTARARGIQEFSFQVFEPFTAAAVLYLLINLIVVASMRGVERLVAVPGALGHGR